MTRQQRRQEERIAANLSKEHKTKHAKVSSRLSLFGVTYGGVKLRYNKYLSDGSRNPEPKPVK